METRVVITWGNEIIAFLNGSCGSDPLQIGTLSSFFPSKTANRNEQITKASTVLGECSYQAGLGTGSPWFSAGHEFLLLIVGKRSIGPLVSRLLGGNTIGKRVRAGQTESSFNT